MTVFRHVIRFIVAAIALLFVGWLVPGFTIVGFWSAFLAAFVIAALGWVLELMFGDRISPNSRGFVGFLVSAIVIYFAQFFITDFRSTFIGALIAAAVIGLIDRFVPVSPRIGERNGDRNRAGDRS